MKKLLVQEYLETKTFGDLVRDHGVYASFSKSGHKFSLNYDQIEAKENDPLAQECRGLILSAHGRAFDFQAKEINGRLNYDHISPGETYILAYPMKRFFNHGQGSAAIIDWADPKLVVLEKLDGCFTYGSLLTCWDGSVISIGEVVKNKFTPVLIGKDKEGNLVPCKVLDWFDNGTKDNWLQVETTLKCRGKRRKFLVTSNHSVFLNGDFRPALEAKVGDGLSTFEHEIDDATKHVIESALLGDGTLSKNGKDYKFEEGHKIEHEAYCDEIVKWLGECHSCSGYYVSGFGTNMKRASSIPNNVITALRKKWYVRGKKRVPRSLGWMDDFAVAKWYMDDGSLAHNDEQQDRALFATNGFTKNEVMRLGRRLTELYGVDCTTYYSKGWCLRVNAGRNGEIDKLWEAIAPHIVSCMRYKLPTHYRNVPYISRAIGTLVKKLVSCKITGIKDVMVGGSKNNRDVFPHGRSGYDIRTSTNNYICNGVLVHNSLCIVYHDPFTEKWCVATRSVSEADLLMDNGLFTFRTLFEKSVKDTLGWSFAELTTNLDKRSTYCFELTTPYNRIVVNYPDNRITLLSVRDLRSMQEMDPKQIQHLSALGIPIVQAHTYSTLDELLTWVSSLNPMEHEGVVVRDANFNRIKVKNAAYVAYNKVRDTLAASERNCVELILAEKDDDVVAFLPEEIVKNLQKIKAGLQVAIRRHDDAYLAAKAQADATLPGDKKTFAILITQSKDLWTAPFFNMFDGKSVNMKDFIAKNRKEGTWGNSFLDKMLEMSKHYSTEA